MSTELYRTDEDGVAHCADDEVLRRVGVEWAQKIRNSGCTDPAIVDGDLDAERALLIVTTTIGPHELVLTSPWVRSPEDQAMLETIE